MRLEHTSFELKLKEVGYIDPGELANRYALDGHEETLERQTAVLAKLAAAAAGRAFSFATRLSLDSHGSDMRVGAWLS